MKLSSELSIAFDIDERLAAIERQIDLLLNITPVNAADAWVDFERSGFSSVPMLQSRPLAFDPDLVKRDLYNLEVELVEDSGLARLLAEKRDEIARQLTLLEDRDTSRFLHESLQIFGPVGDELVRLAHDLLDLIDVPKPPGKRVTASAFAEAAEREFAWYRERYPDFAATVALRDDVADLMVVHGHLLVPADASFGAHRVEPLIQHEIGTHIVTYENGARQQLRLLTVGLPGYDETQEGLAVLSEFVTGGLDPNRLRLLAARVVAVRRMVDGAGFIEIFNELHDELGFAPRTAWSVTIRVARSGGLTKDVIYLRGIARVLEFVAQRKTIDALLVGKLSVDQVPLIEELMDGGVIEPPHIRPRWTQGPHAEERLARAYEGLSVQDLAEESMSR